MVSVPNYHSSGPRQIKCQVAGAGARQLNAVVRLRHDEVVESVANKEMQQ